MRSVLSILLAAPAVLGLATVDKRQTAETIAGQWIARLDDNAPLATVLTAVTALAGIQPTHRYEIGSFRAFAFDGEDSIVDLIASVASISSITPDTMVYASAPLGERALVQQSPTEWGLARISHRNTGATNYIYDNSAGSGTTAYVIDTGVYTQHNDFGGRAVAGANYISGESNTDGNGHGTHCAGTVAGSAYGVAKRANVIGVKVLSSQGSGSNSGVIAGIQWAVNNANQNGRISRSVISMSLGGGFDQNSNDAVASAVRSGMFVAVAAGNSGRDARGFSPASEPTVCTVGATDSSDRMASFSNFGPVVDIFAPGVSIRSAWIRSPSDTNTISGTSMACPHVAGLAAYLIALEGPRSPAALCQRIQELSTKNRITSLGAGSLNYLAYNGNGA